MCYFSACEISNITNHSDVFGVKFWKQIYSGTTLEVVQEMTFSKKRVQPLPAIFVYSILVKNVYIILLI